MPELLILQLQFDLVDLQFLQKALRVGSGLDSRPFLRLLTQPEFGKTAQFAVSRVDIG
jgi:hypothetical protein